MHVAKQFCKESHMNLDGVIESLPSYAKDLKLNFSSVVRQQSELTEQQVWGTVVASAVASRNEQLIAAAVDEAATRLTPEALDAAKKHRELSRATIMKLANSLPVEEPLRQIFLSAPIVRKILGDRETPRSRAKEA